MEEKHKTLTSTIETETAKVRRSVKHRIAVEEKTKEIEAKRRKKSNQHSTDIKKKQDEKDELIQENRSVVGMRRLLMNATKIQFIPTSDDVIQGIVLTTPMLKPFRISLNTDVVQISEQLWSLIGD